MNQSEPRTSKFGMWMALIAALLGWLFDGLEMGLFPLVQSRALADLVEESQRSLWIGVITSSFLIGAATGGVLFGWLGDRIGRVRSMMLSVLTYALVSALCGIASSAWQIAVFRFVAALGMGGEWSLGVALINELWPNRSRAFLAGLIGAAANVGYMIIAVVGVAIINNIEELRGRLDNLGLPATWIEHLLHNGGWRLLMMFGALPALLTFFIRVFVPESEKWEAERGKGATSHWATEDLIGVLVGAVAAAGVIALWTIKSPESLEPFFLWIQFVCTVVGFAVVAWGYMLPVQRYLKRAAVSDPSVGGGSDPTLKYMMIAACLSGVALLGTWGSTQQAPAVADGLAQAIPEAERPAAKEHTQIATATGAIVGTIFAALLGGWIGRRITYFLLCLGSLVIIPAFYLLCRTYDTTFLIVAFFAGAITASFYGWLPLYLPELFRTPVRATGQGFGFNFGRVLAAIGVLQLGNLRNLFKDFAAEHGYHELAVTCSVLAFIYVIGMAIIWLAPETKGKPLPE